MLVYRRCKKYDLLPSICIWLSKMGGNTISCHQFMTDYKKWEQIRFVATNIRSIIEDGKTYDLIPPICAGLSSMARRQICCRQSVLYCQRWEEIRFVATSLCLLVKDGTKFWLLPSICLRFQCLIIKDGKKYDLLPPICVRLSKMERSSISCPQFVLHYQRWEEVRLVATSLWSIVKDWKK